MAAAHSGGDGRAVTGPSVTLEVADAVATLRISNPGKRNAFTWAMYEQLAAAVQDLPPEARVLVLRGDAEDGFAAGTDIGQFVGFSGEDGLEYERTVGAVLDAVLAVDIPVIALVERTAIGAGLALACCADLVLAERGALFGAPIAKTLGNCIPPAVLARLRSKAGEANAMAMLLTATLLPAERLEGSGFVFRTVEPGQLDEAAAELLRRIVTSAPLTLRSLKEMNRRITAALPVPEADDLLLACYGSDDFAEGVDAFLGGRRPEWRGR